MKWHCIIAIYDCNLLHLCNIISPSRKAQLGDVRYWLFVINLRGIFALDTKKKCANHDKYRNSNFETILDSIADGVFTIDLDFNITYFNSAAQKITGVSSDQALGQKCFDVFRANICQTDRSASRETLPWYSLSPDCTIGAASERPLPTRTTSPLWPAP